MSEIVIPDPKLQWEKTPSRIKVKRQFTDPETGELVEVTRWGPWFEETGSVTWKEWRDRVLLAGEHTYDEMKGNLEKMGGKPKKASKKGVLAGVIELYIRQVGWDEYESKTVADFEREIEEFAQKQGRWGLGCPHLCGRFWELKPTEDFSFFEPSDKMALTPFVDEEGVSHNGYLEWEWKHDEAGNLTGARFICDRCKGVVELTL